MEGLVGNIQKYSLHDGPGIRSTVFLKGCPLTCAWCHNPEYQDGGPLLTQRAEKCLACGDCLLACPTGAISLSGAAGWRVDFSRCSNCGACVAACPTLAIEQISRCLSAEQVIAELAKDAPFYDASGGGITISGGEPLSQCAFAAELLAQAKDRGWHTAIDTSGFGSWRALAALLADCDLFLYDLKHLDEAAHQQATGVSLAPILENLRRLAASEAEIWLRIPVIPGFNEDEALFQRIGELARELAIQRVHLLPYHAIAQGKYQRLGYQYRLPDLAAPTAATMARLQEVLLRQGLDAYLGG